MPASDVSLMIGGESRAAASTFDRANPVTGEIATRAAAASVDDARAAVDAAQAAFPAWAALGPNARRAALLKAADALDACADDFVDAMMSEIGATEGWARFNIMLSSSMVREAASLTTQIGGEVRTIIQDERDFVLLGDRQKGSGGAPDGVRPRHIVLWSILLGTVIITLLFAGGMDALRSVMIIGALPFSAVMIFMLGALLYAIWVDQHQR